MNDDMELEEARKKVGGERAEYVVHLKKQSLTHDKFCEKSKVANMV